MNNSDRFIHCAVIGAPFGVRGAMHVYPSSGQFDHLLGLKEFFYEQDGNYLSLKVQSLRAHQDHLVIALEHVHDPETAKKMVHRQLFAELSALPVLPAEQYYWYQLEGLNVSSLEGLDLGIVASLYSNGPQDIMITSLAHHIPFVRERIVKSVDLALKKIIVDFNPLYIEA